ncbi:MAG: hypothetical protein ISP74_00705 [Bacteroidia bacterium]|nr:hypothetical protein [Bacteroidia bacterium]
MKKITLILLLFSATALIMTTGCGSDDKPTTPSNNNPQDSTTTASIDNQIQIGLELFKFNEDIDRTFGEYNSSDTSTYISVFGNDPNYGDASFNITFPGQTTGSFVTVVGSSEVDFQAGAGEEGTIYREEFSASGSTMNIEVTEYGAIGEHIKGTFSGTVKNGKTGQSVNITKGKFDVIRRDDQ